MPKIVPTEIKLEFQEQIGPYTRACFMVGGLRVADVTMVDPRSKEVQKLLAKLRAGGIPTTVDAYGKMP